MSEGKNLAEDPAAFQVGGRNFAGNRPRTVPGSARTMSERGWLRISEIFESIQGEGASAGTPSVFLRLATCNLRCTWCDTRYTWDWSAYRYDDEVKRVAVHDVVARVVARRLKTLKLSGERFLLSLLNMFASFSSSLT